MSNPINPLDRFRSYNYHHILIAADSTEALRKLTNPNMSSGEEQKILDSLKLGQKITLDSDSNASFFVICDTRKNSYFNINDVSYTTTLNAGNSKLYSLIFGDLTISFTDTSGITLLNYLDHIAKNELKINFHRMVFLLKTVFVGHTEDGTTETIFQNAIPMLLKSLDATAGHLGSTLNGVFCPLNSGAVPYFPEFSKVQDIAGINSVTGRLADALKILEDTLNIKSRKWYQDLQIKINGDAPEDKKPTKGYGRLVQYMITLPEDWSTFTLQGVTEKMSESEFDKTGKRMPVNPQGVYIGLKTTPDTTIQEIIDSILKQSNEVQKLASNENRMNENVKSYKIVTNITSDDSTVTIHFDVVNYVIPRVTKASATQNNVSSTSNKSVFELSDNNKMEFDYIFSGKNTDILSFDMKMNNVNLFLADNLFVGDRHAQEVNKDQTNKTTDNTTTNEKQLVMRVREKDPITPPEKTGSQQSNMPWIVETDDRSDGVKARQQFINNIAVAHGMSSFDVILKIRGNPDLYRRFSENDLMPHVKIVDSLDTSHVLSDSFIFGQNMQFLSASDKKAYLDAQRKTMVRQFGNESVERSSSPVLLPFFIKINVFGTNYNLEELDNAPFADFKPFEKLFYNDYYLVTKVNHSFSGGTFTQELLISATPQDLYGETAKND